MKDLLFFFCFIVIFLLGFSITSWALLTTSYQVTWNYDSNGTLENYYITGDGSGLWDWFILRNVTNYGIWKIFGQVDPIGKRQFFILIIILFYFLDGTDAYSAVAFVLAILFVAISNVLLLNVLVALFKYEEKLN
jgi:hypothetical protein